MNRREERAARIEEITASKDAWHAKTTSAGHAMTWRLDDCGPGYSPTWYGTCGNCGATMSVFPGGTSIGDRVGRCARDIPCPGPGTAWQDDMIRDLAHERVTAAVSRFGQEVKDNADRAWLAGQGLLVSDGPAAEPPAAWKELAAQTGEFDPEDDAHLLAWMSGEAAGMAGYAEAVAAAYDTAVSTIGLDPAALSAMHECADAASEAAQRMAAAREAFTAHYAEVRQFAVGGGVLPFNGRWMTGEDAGRTAAAGRGRPVPGGKGPAPLPAAVTVALADGEARTAAVSTADGGSYACPWCGSPVLSPQAWQESQRAGAALAERLGEPAPQPRPYPGDQAAAWNARSCANPACWTAMTAGHLADARARAAAEGERRREGERLRQWDLERVAERRRQEEELWERLTAEAAEHGSCLRCLRDSDWRSGRPRMVRHRSPDYHDTH